jgi:prepilin-type processing-associated H-X9-DG protein
MYANDNDNWLPFRENWSDLYRRPPESGEMADTDGWVYVNCGLLISGKYISKEVLHCAGSEEKGIDTWSGNREAILNTYWYLNPYRYNNGDILRLGNLPTNVLMTDYMYARYGYVDGFNHGSNGLNVLFVDSSVRWVIDHRIYGLLDGVKNNDDWATSYNAITDCWNYIEEAY